MHDLSSHRRAMNVVRPAYVTALPAVKLDLDRDTACDRGAYASQPPPARAACGASKQMATDIRRWRCRPQCTPHIIR